MNTLIEDDAPRRSVDIRAEIRGLERQVSDAAERHDNAAYNVAVNELQARRIELTGVSARETVEAREAATVERHRVKFQAETGFDTPGDLIANQLRTDQRARHEAFAAVRHAEVAEALFAPKPTPAEQAADVLNRIRTAAKTAADRVEQQHDGGVIRLADKSHEGNTAA